MIPSSHWHLFEAYGIELEYMIVDSHTLNVKPIADEILHDVAGAYVNEVERGAIAWSNELVMHVIELKTNGPARSLDGLHEQFQAEVEEINSLLEPHDARLLPTAMHPWMDPYTETRLWPHEYNPIYEAYNQIFDCRGHGWANLQSIHINLPFASDEEFEKLHAAIRILLPILPGIAASSPVAGFSKQMYADYRLEVYRTNSTRIPSVTGKIIPEPVFSRESYDREIFQRMYRDIAPYDPGNILQEEWLNARGAIARFDRGSIEIRMLDIQECPLADMAIVRIIIDTLKELTQERWSSLDDQKSWGEHILYDILIESMKNAERARLGNIKYASLFGLSASGQITAGDLWKHLFYQLYQHVDIDQDPVLQALKKIINSGTLSSRMSMSLRDNFSRKEVFTDYEQLSDCLARGLLYRV